MGCVETVTRAIDELREIAARSSDAEVVATVTRKLKALVLVANDTTDDGRAIRRRALGAIKSIRLNDLTQDFMAADLRKNDIIDADLTRATMKGLDLSGSFMISHSLRRGRSDRSEPFDRLDQKRRLRGCDAHRREPAGDRLVQCRGVRALPAWISRSDNHCALPPGRRGSAHGSRVSHTTRSRILVQVGSDGIRSRPFAANLEDLTRPGRRLRSG